MILEDPNAGAQSAIANIGLGSCIRRRWWSILHWRGKSFMGKLLLPALKLAESLGAITDRLGGRERRGNYR